MIDMNSPALKFEHELRRTISAVQKRIEDCTEASHASVRFEKFGSDDGKWSINSWGGGTQDITTRGAVLETILNEHIRRVGKENELQQLPALLAAPNPPMKIEDEEAPSYTEMTPDEFKSALFENTISPDDGSVHYVDDEGNVLMLLEWFTDLPDNAVTYRFYGK